MSNLHETVLSPILRRLDALETENAALKAQVDDLQKWSIAAQTELDGGSHWTAIHQLADALNLEWDDALQEMEAS